MFACVFVCFSPRSFSTQRFFRGFYLLSPSGSLLKGIMLVSWFRWAGRDKYRWMWKCWMHSANPWRWNGSGLREWCFFQKEARGCWCSVKSTRRCFEWMIYWLMLLLKKTTSVVDNIWWKNLRLKWEISPCWHQLHQFLSSVKPNDGTEINIHTVFLAETQEVLADAMSGGGMAGVFCRLEIARSKGRVALWCFFQNRNCIFKFQPEPICLLWWWC